MPRILPITIKSQSRRQICWLSLASLLSLDNMLSAVTPLLQPSCSFATFRAVDVLVVNRSIRIKDDGYETATCQQQPASIFVLVDIIAVCTFVCST